MIFVERSVLRVLVVDDHELTRFSLKAAFRNQTDIELVGLASNGYEAVEMVQSSCPDVIVLDLQMPILDGMSAAIAIKRIAPHVQILAYSSLEDPKIEPLLRDATIAELCRKDMPTADLIAMVRQLGRPLVEYPVF